MEINREFDEFGGNSLTVKGEDCEIVPVESLTVSKREVPMHGIGRMCKGINIKQAIPDG